MRRFAILSAAIVLAGGVLLWRAVDDVADRSTAAPVAAPAITAATAAAARAVASPTPIAATRATAAAATDVPHAHVPGAAPSDPEGAAMDAAFERRFAADARDATWSAATIDQLTRTFAEPALAGSTLDDADCRGSMCRLVVAHADGEAAARFLSAAGASPAFRGAGAARPLVDPTAPNRIQTLVFVMREGEPLPAL